MENICRDNKQMEEIDRIWDDLNLRVAQSRREFTHAIQTVAHRKQMEKIDRIWNDSNLRVAQSRREFTLLRIWNLTCRQESFTLLAPCWWSKCELPDLTLHYAIIAQVAFLFEICRLTGIQPYNRLPTVIRFRSSWRRDMDIYKNWASKKKKWKKHVHTPIL